MITVHDHVIIVPAQSALFVINVPAQSALFVINVPALFCTICDYCSCSVLHDHAIIIPILFCIIYGTC